MKKKFTSVLQEADYLTSVVKQKSYGHPLYNLGLTAKFWSIILGVTITAEQVALCMITFKIAREIFKEKKDNRVDLAGYTKTLDQIVEMRALILKKKRKKYGISSRKPKRKLPRRSNARV